MESTMLPDFERDAYVNMFIKEQKDEAEITAKMQNIK